MKEIRFLLDKSKVEYEEYLNNILNKMPYDSRKEYESSWVNKEKEGEFIFYNGKKIYYIDSKNYNNLTIEIDANIEIAELDNGIEITLLIVKEKLFYLKMTFFFLIIFMVFFSVLSGDFISGFIFYSIIVGVFISLIYLMKRKCRKRFIKIMRII